MTPIKDIHKKRKLTSSDVKKLQEDYRKRKVGKKYVMYEGDILSDKKNPLVEVTYATKKSLDIKKIKEMCIRDRYKVDVASDRRRRKNVSRHILCSSAIAYSGR